MKCVLTIYRQFMLLFVVIGRFQIADKWVNAKKGQEKKKEGKIVV